ncbi:MAG: agmatinase [Candidatus Hodarchaeales archaeon]|jgi:agmatinase
MTEESYQIDPKTFFFGATCDSLVEANFAVVGIPWDISSSYRIGSAKAPAKIRAATTGELYNPYTEQGLNIQDKWKIFDCGDIKISTNKESEVKEQVVKTLEPLSGKIKNFLFLGGDHLATYFSVCALTKLNAFSDKKIGIIYLDSHPDLYNDYKGDPYSHACVLRRILDESPISPENICQVGIRAATPDQLEFIEKTGISMVSTDEILRKGIKSITGEITEMFKDSVDLVYLSIDLDVLDPAFVPGIGNPEPGGLSTAQLIQIVKNMNSLPAFSFDIVEYNPNYDNNQITAFTAAKIIKETLGILK